MSGQSEDDDDDTYDQMAVGTSVGSAGTNNVVMLIWVAWFVFLGLYFLT
ncbi:MAG: hypothetical protein K2Q01_10325 [Rickettsiales bacterium]|nr:hypothetical protein [Rickettsiales bacterium]